MWSQPTLLDGIVDEPTAAAFRPERTELDATSWVDLCSGWLAGADHALDDLLHNLVWRGGERIVFHQRFVEPRLSAGYEDPRDHPVTAMLQAALEAHYQRPFHEVFCNQYRDGDDAVAWHRDRIHRRDSLPLVAILTLGATRTFSLRPHGGGPSVRFRPAAGDVLVMGGASQQDWEHAVLRTRRPVGPRVSVTIRSLTPG